MLVGLAGLLAMTVLKGNDAGGHFYKNPADKGLSLAPANGTLARVDELL